MLQIEDDEDEAELPTDDHAGAFDGTQVDKSDEEQGADVAASSQNDMDLQKPGKQFPEGDVDYMKQEMSRLKKLRSSLLLGSFGQPRNCRFVGV